MGSYFDIKPSSKATVDDPDGAAFKQMGMLTPQVTRILDDLDLEEHSSSEEEASASEDSDPRPDPNALRKASTSPLPETKHAESATSPRPSLGAGSARETHPHLARFHSLRSILFSSNIEDSMEKHHEERAKAEAEAKWRAEHEQRRGLNRPKTPESPKPSPTKESFTHRIGDRIKRMTNKDVPTMKSIGEDYDNESTASSDQEDDYRAHLGSDDESINQEDVEDLVRWVSRRDPPSDGENRKSKHGAPAVAVAVAKEDSGHESLGHSDVEDLVRWVNRKEPQTTEADAEDFDLSDASTEEDSEAGGARQETMNDEDADELVRWISHKEGPNAGPVHEQKPKMPTQTKMNDSDANRDSRDEELVRWVTRRDDASGESDFIGDEGVAKPKHKPSAPEESRLSLAETDVDELVRWVSRKEEKRENPDEETRGRSPRREKEATITDDDVDDLVRWVSRREKDPKDEAQRDDNIMKWKQEEDEKKQELAMKHDKGILEPDDVDELVQWVSNK